jgi:hypothetical protein
LARGLGFPDAMAVSPAFLLCAISTQPATDPSLALRIDDTRRLATSSIQEPSGLVRSRRHPELYWTHGDHGSTPDLFAITATGELVQSHRITNAENVDWEDIAIDDDGFLYVADFGNNHEDRQEFSIYKIPEPAPRSSGPVPAVSRVRFDYPDRPKSGPQRNVNFDAEALFHSGGELYVLSKHRADTKTTLYRVPEVKEDARVLLEKITEFDVGGRDRPYGGMVTGASLDPTRARLAVLSYHALFIFETKPDEPLLSRLVARVDLDQSLFRQCEAVAWTDSGVLVLNEEGVLFRLRM